MADGFVLLSEVCWVLAAHGQMRGSVDVETAGDDLVLTVVVQRGVVPGYPETGFEPLALLHELQHLRDVGQVRAFAANYGVPDVLLDAFVRGGER